MECEGVVGRVAVVGRRTDYDESVFRQCIHVAVERALGNGEPASATVLGDFVGNPLGGPQIRSVQHEDRVPAAVVGDDALRCSRLGCGIGSGGSTRAGDHRRLAACAGSDGDGQILGLDREGVLDVELVVEGVDEVEALQDQSEQQL